MAIPAQPTVQTTPTRPTPEQIALARSDVQASLEYNVADINALRVLLAATEPPTDKDIADFAMHWSTPDWAKNEEWQSARDKHIESHLAMLRLDVKVFTSAAQIARAALRHFFGPVKP